MTVQRFTRRSLLAASVGAASGAMALPAWARTSAASPRPLDRLKALEARHGGRLGVSILDLRTGRRVDHRGEQRFALCSTFKLLAAAFVLARSDRGQDDLQRRMTFDRSDLVTYSPVTEKHIGKPGMTLSELCEAAVVTSDNTAGNLLLASFGGPSALTAFLRSLGDRSTRLDRIETALNENRPGDPRDTTTPAAMLGSLRTLLYGDESLSVAARDQLKDWMTRSPTGARRLRAALSAGWIAGDKTGTGALGATNDVAFLRPPGADAKPLLVTAYYDAPDDLALPQREAVLAEVGRIAVSLVPASRQ